MLTKESDVVNAKDDETVVLARGCNKTQLSKYQYHVGDDKTSRPSESDAIMQVGEFGSPYFIEFTSDLSVAQRFGKGGFVIYVKIQKKYLTKGSVSEGGWICRADAPFELTKIEKGGSFLY